MLHHSSAEVDVLLCKSALSILTLHLCLSLSLGLQFTFQNLTEVTQQPEEISCVGPKVPWGSITQTGFCGVF